MRDKERRTLLAIAKRQAAGDDSRIKFDDIPHLTDEQWAAAVRFATERPKYP
jgi:hypothetical protein